MIVRRQPSETDRGGNRHLVCGQAAHRRAVKGGSKVINHNCVNSKTRN